LDSEKKLWPEENVLTWLRDTFKIDVLTKSDEDEIAAHFDMFAARKWDLVPDTHKDKEGFETSWQIIPHTDINEWREWVINGFNWSVKCGERSGITVVDIDDPETYEQVKHMMGVTLTSKTRENINKFHYFYQYDADFPSHINLKLETGLGLEVINGGHKVTLPPCTVARKEKIDDKKQIVGYDKRRFVTPLDQPIIAMPAELKKFLLEKIALAQETRKSKQGVGSNAVIDKALNDATKIGMDGDQRIIRIGDGDGRNNLLTSIMGQLRHKLDLDQTVTVAKIINDTFYLDKLPLEDIKRMAQSIDKYNTFDEKELARKVLEYITLMEERSENQIKQAFAEDKKKLDKVLMYLVREELIKKFKNIYVVQPHIEWETELAIQSKPVEFKVPYFHDIARFNYGDMLLLGAPPGSGKTTMCMNIIKRLVEQGVRPDYIYSEATGGFAETAIKLGLKRNDFRFKWIPRPERMKLDSNSVTIIDWLMIEEKQYSDVIFQKLAEQMYGSNGLLIVLQQLKKFTRYDNSLKQDVNTYEWYAPNMVEQFPTFAVKLTHGINDGGRYPELYTTKIRLRQPGITTNFVKIPCEYNDSTKEIFTIAEVEAKRAEIEKRSADSAGSQQ